MDILMGTSTAIGAEPPKSAPRSRSRLLWSILILVGLSGAAVAVFRLGAPQLAPAIVGLPAALKVLLDILDGQKSATLPGEDVDKKPPLRMKKGIRVACVIGFVYVLGYFTPSITTGLLKPIVWL
jgi:hypothetical protein